MLETRPHSRQLPEESEDVEIANLNQVCPEQARSAVVAVGNFDGVHKGHQEIIKQTIKLAKKSGQPSAVMTFEPHPVKLFSPDSDPIRLTPFDMKAKIIGNLGIDFLFICNFNKEFSQMSADDFIGEMLVKKISASTIVVGKDFVFGHKRGGNLQLLVEQAGGYGFSVVEMPEVADGGAKYSSTSIRKLLKSGDVESANRYLGRKFQISGIVAKGDGIGRKIGFPTANIELGEYVRPKFGVYQVSVAIDRADKFLPAIASLGINPTFENKKERLEVYIFDFDGDIYGKSLDVRFHKFMREEKKFKSAEDLVEQIKQDCELVKSLFVK